MSEPTRAEQLWGLERQVDNAEYDLRGSLAALQRFVDKTAAATEGERAAQSLAALRASAGETEGDLLARAERVAACYEVAYAEVGLAWACISARREAIVRKIEEVRAGQEAVARLNREAEVLYRRIAERRGVTLEEDSEDEE